jgi:hypothetical protein
LDQYRERFPNGRFSVEASALRIEALAALGKRAEARTLAQRFMKRHPKSLLVERVRPYAAGPENRSQAGCAIQATHQDAR